MRFVPHRRGDCEEYVLGVLVPTAAPINETECAGARLDGSCQ